MSERPEKKVVSMEYELQPKRCYGCGLTDELIEIRRMWWCKACGTLAVLTEDKNIVNPIMHIEVPALLREKKIVMSLASKGSKDERG